ncbi:MAG TPA: sensor domain-containing protein [Nocardiopsis listeri]|uniref:sensor histidine kinase n=1 Tax=Nocardiopsis listeri TaxID=53440 RepID=UPI001D744077|nr:sensor histidine kinase [Nocardiopsis listeri]HJE57122.1 sensor domain-containing protein [Nocardiopsis listeri]
MSSPNVSDARTITLLRALAGPRYLLGSWVWRALAYTLTTILVGGVLMMVAFPVYVPLAASVVMIESRAVGDVIFLFLFGVVMVVCFGPLIAIPLGAVERRRLRIVLPGPDHSGHREPPAGLWGWFRTRYTEAATWREVAYAAVMLVLFVVTLSLVGFLFTTTLTLAATPFILRSPEEAPLSMGPFQLHSSAEALPFALASPLFAIALLYACGLLSYGHGVVARSLLVGPPKEELYAELGQVTESRARLVNAFEYERRRIERDLHDGAQQRLVALSMDLGMARVDLDEDSPADRRVVAAQAKADELIDEIRELVRGIHPRVLTDRGLPAALAELADHCPVPVTVDADLPRRQPPHVEGTAYFVVAEALTNAYKHTEANAVTVHADLREESRGDVLTVEVTDYGPGGADPSRGSGLTGMADRVAVMGGTMDLSSPVGGPTRIRVELPCTTDRPETQR